MENGRYSLDKAQEEALELQKKVESGEASNYSEAEKKLDIEETLEEIRSQYEKGYYNDNMRVRENLGYSFLENLTYTTTGHTWKSYSLRNRPEEAPDFYKKEYRPDKIDKEVSDFYKSKFKDNLILDLGAGNLAVGYVLSDALEAGGYIAVEMNFAEHTKTWIERYKGKTPSVVVQEDMGKFIGDFNGTGKKLKVIIFSGIEGTSYTGKIDFEQIIKGISDILDDDGILIHAGNLGWADEDYGSYLNNLFEATEDDGHKKTNCRIYRKKVNKV